MHLHCFYHTSLFLSLGRSRMAGLPKRILKNICVFSGTTLGSERVYLDEANKLGRLLADKKMNLIYGGGSLGLMGCVSAATFVEGGSVLGIVPSALADPKFIGFTLGDELKVASMHEKMGKMMINADAFIALPGGLGTLEEIFNIASWAQLNLHHKPIGLLNINGFYDGLLSFLDHIVEQGFMKLSARKILISAPTADQLMNQLQNYVPELDPVMSLVPWSTMNNKVSTPNKKSKKQEIDLTLRL